MTLSPSPLRWKSDIDDDLKSRHEQLAAQDEKELP